MRAPAAAAAMAAVLAFAAGASPARAGMPEWAKAAAEAAPPVSAEGMPEWPQRTLLTDTSIVLSPDGATWRISRRKVMQVLSARVDPTAFGFFAFDDTTKIKKSKGWHALPGEHSQRDLGGALDMSIPANFLTDAKARVVTLDGVKKGSLLAYEFQAESHPYTLTNVESFFEDVPVSLARWSIALPAGWGLKYVWLPEDGPAPVQSGTTWTFERREMVPVREETMGEDPVDLAPRLVVALQPPSGAAVPTPAFADWDALGRWYQELAKGRETSTPEIQAAVKGLLAKAGPEPLDKIRAVSLFVRDRVRYLDREVGIGGYQPHPASQVLSELYGDCKDKGTLLRAALQVAGFASYPILINASNPYTVAPDVPSPGSFDHFVVGVVWPKDAPFPDSAASARVDAGNAGTVLVVDPTDEDSWPGTLPDNLAGKTVVVVAEGRGVLLTLPDAQPKWHRINRAASVTVGADRSVEVQLVSKMYGGPAATARRENAVSFKDRREDVEDVIRQAWPGAAIKDYKVLPEDGDGAYVETVALSLPAGSSALQDNVYWMFAGATKDIDRVPLGKRKTAVQYPYPFDLRYEVVVKGAPAGVPLPDPVKLSGPSWTVHTEFRRDGDVLHAAWSADLTRAHFDPAAFSDLKQFWSAASKAATPGVTLAQ